MTLSMTTMKRWISCAILTAAVGCEPDHERCDPDQKYLHGLCYQIDAGIDGGIDAGPDAAAGADASLDASAAATTPPGSPGSPDTPGPRSGSGG